MTALVEPVEFLVSGYPYSELPLTISGVPFNLKFWGETIACVGIIYLRGICVCSRFNGKTIVDVNTPEGIRITKRRGYDSWDITSEVTETGRANLKRLAQRAINRFDNDRAWQLDSILKSAAPTMPVMSDADLRALEGIRL